MDRFDLADAAGKRTCSQSTMKVDVQLLIGFLPGKRFFVLELALHVVYSLLL